MTYFSFVIDTVQVRKEQKVRKPELKSASFIHKKLQIFFYNQNTIIVNFFKLLI